jgi:hypothetical protein
LLDDMREFLRKECGLSVSPATVSRAVKKINPGSDRQHGRAHRLKLKRQREAEGRALDYGLGKADGNPDELMSATKDATDAGSAATETWVDPALAAASVDPDVFLAGPSPPEEIAEL